MSAIYIIPRLVVSDPDEVQSTMQEYVALVDRFYKVSEHLAPHQYRVAKQDYKYFLQLLELAIAYYREEE
jgi:hypothetical protein